MRTLSLLHLFLLGVALLAASTITTLAQQDPQPSQQKPLEPAGTPAAPSAMPQKPAPDVSTSDDQTFVFKKQVEEVVLHATVVDERGRLETHLDQKAFTVFEDGQRQSITSFRREDVPVAIGVLIDNSGSMRDKREEVNRAVLNMIRAGNPQDQVFVVNFSRNPYLDQDFTGDINLLEQALHRAAMQGSTALYDAVIASANHLKSNSRLEKKILLVVTDGEDNMSRQTLEEAIRQLQQKNGPTLYAIGLIGPEDQSQGREALQRLADATGGTAFFPRSVDQVADITDALAHDIRNQYTISYTPQNENANASYHPIAVEARAPEDGKLTVRTRGGYYTGESVR